MGDKLTPIPSPYPPTGLPFLHPNSILKTKTKQNKKPLKLFTLKLNTSNKSESCSFMSNYLWPHGLHSPWNSPGQNTGGGSFSLLWDLPNLGIRPRSPTLQADSLPAEPQAKPKNTGVGSLSLLQRIFLIQESNWGLRHCRWTLCQLSHEERTFLFHFLLKRLLSCVTSLQPQLWS